MALSIESQIRRAVADAVGSKGAKNIQPGDFDHISGLMVIQVHVRREAPLTYSIKVATQSHGTHYHTVRIAAKQ
jgi:hypothetical protein